MILTEDQAKTKRCQEGFGPSSDKTAMQSVGIWTQPAFCIASGCMAWRWHTYDLDPVDHHQLNGLTGYCGKAGTP